MKTIKFSAIIATAFVMVISLTMLTSFKTEPSEKENCNVTCTFTASTSTISTGLIENVNGNDSKTGISTGTSQTATLNASGASTTYISLYLPFGHTPGTIYIYKNGSLVNSYYIPSNSVGIDADPYSTSCGDHFDVTW